jgi:YHS domain-containing protein
MRLVALLVIIIARSAADAGVATAPAQATPTDRVVNDRCPVMTDEPATPRHEIDYQGVLVRFCCDECKEKFAAKPARYVAHVPQLSPALVQSVEAAAVQDATNTPAAAWVDGWPRAVMLALAGLLTAWLVVRVARRRSRDHASDARTSPSSAPNDVT